MREPLALAETLRAAHPNIEPLEVDAGQIADLLDEQGADGCDDALIAAVIEQWDGLLL